MAIKQKQPEWTMYKPSHSDFLIHWTGDKIDKEYDPEWWNKKSSILNRKIIGPYLERLKYILKYGLWMTQIDFFRTPYFSIEINGKEIDIKILNHQKVDANTMRIINRIYTVFRNRLGSRKKRWGEDSGRRLAIAQRDKNLRKLYAQLRNEKPNVASSRLYDQLEEWTHKIGLPIFTERIKKIVYSKK